jgi:hypothetical protein
MAGLAFRTIICKQMESFLLQAGIEMYSYDQLSVGNFDVPGALDFA